MTLNDLFHLIVAFAFFIAGWLCLLGVFHPTMQMIGFVAFSLRRAWQGFWRNALMSLAATATMVLMLVLLAGFWIIQTGLLSALDFTEAKVEVVANIRLDATPADVAALESNIRAMPEVTGTTFVSLAAPAGWTCTAPAVGASGTVSCTIPTLAVGNASFTLVVHVPPSAAGSSLGPSRSTANWSTL